LTILLFTFRIRIEMIPPKIIIDVDVICRIYLLHRQGAICTVLKINSDELSAMNAAQREFVAGFIMNYPATTAAHTLSSTQQLNESLCASIAEPISEPAAHTLSSTQQLNESLCASIAEPISEPAAVFAPLPVPPVPQLVPAPPVPIVAATGPQLIIPPTVEIETPKLDKSGLPWDERIHANTKGFTGNGLWRRKRGVLDSEYDGVTAQLRQLMNLPDPFPSAPAVPVVFIGVAGLNRKPGVGLMAGGAATAPAIVGSAIPAATVEAVPSVDNRKAYIDLVGQCGKFIAAGKLTKEDVNNACATATGGVAATLPMLGNRPEFVPSVAQIITTLVESR
jgi:hypothetical protein